MPSMCQQKVKLKLKALVLCQLATGQEMVREKILQGQGK